MLVQREWRLLIKKKKVVEEAKVEKVKEKCFLKKPRSFNRYLGVSIQSLKKVSPASLTAS